MNDEIDFEIDQKLNGPPPSENIIYTYNTAVLNGWGATLMGRFWYFGGIESAKRQVGNK